MIGRQGRLQGGEGRGQKGGEGGVLGCVRSQLGVGEGWGGKEWRKPGSAEGAIDKGVRETRVPGGSQG